MWVSNGGAAYCTTEHVALISPPLVAGFICVDRG